MRFTNLRHYQHEIHMNNYEMLLLLLDIIQSYTNIKATPNQAIKVLQTKHPSFSTSDVNSIYFISWTSFLLGSLLPSPVSGNSPGSRPSFGKSKLTICSIPGTSNPLAATSVALENGRQRNQLGVEQL